MGKKSDLTNDEKSSIRILLGQGLDTLDISKVLKRDHRTIQRYVNEGKCGRKKCPKRGFKKVSRREINRIKHVMIKTPHLTSKRIFEEANVENIARSTRCRVLRDMGKVKNDLKKPPSKNAL